MFGKRFFALLVLTAIAWAGPVGAQSVGLPAPRLLTVTPMGAKVGTEVEVAITGEHLDEVTDLIFSDTRLRATVKRDPNGQPIAHRYAVSVAATCPVGLYEARVQTRLGLSSARIFSVGTLNEVLALSTNKTLATAQEVPLNSVINGVVSDRQIDYFKFSAQQGQRVVVDCATRGIDSKLNATVILGDEAGRDLLVERRGGVLDFTVPKDGTYTIKIHELTFKGGPAYYYRLAVREQPKDTPIVRQASTQAVNAYSWPPVGLPEKSSSYEVEPNDSKTPQRITLPCDLSGRFFPAADVDVFEFDAKKGEEWWIEVASERLGLPTDPAILVQQVLPGTPERLSDVLELTDVPSPVKVSSNGYAYDGPPYNAGTSDILGKLVVPVDGRYRVQLTDLFGGTRSVPHHQYRLIIRRAAPDFALVGWALHMELRNGDRNALSKPIALRTGATMALEVVAYRRDGFNGDIDLVMDGLPQGVTASGLKIPAGQSRGMMLITAASDAPSGYANATFVGRGTIDGKQVTRPCRVASMAWPIPDSWGEIPSPRLLADVPVSVNAKDKAPLSLAAKTPLIEAKAGTKVVVPLTLQRNSDFSGTIQMKMVGAGFERTPSFTLAVDKPTAEITLDLKTLNVPPGEYRISCLGGGVVKYQHQPDVALATERATQKLLGEVKSLESEVQKATTNVQKAPAEKKDQMTKELAATTAKMKAATTTLTAMQERLKRAQEAAKPRDIADIFVCEPFTIRVTPAEKK